jgi:hypothetical protein
VSWRELGWAGGRAGGVGRRAGGGGVDPPGHRWTPPRTGISGPARTHIRRFAAAHDTCSQPHAHTQPHTHAHLQPAARRSPRLVRGGEGEGCQPLRERDAGAHFNLTAAVGPRGRAGYGLAVAFSGPRPRDALLERPRLAPRSCRRRRLRPSRDRAVVVEPRKRRIDVVSGRQRQKGGAELQSAEAGRRLGRRSNASASAGRKAWAAGCARGGRSKRGAGGVWVPASEGIGVERGSVARRLRIFGVREGNAPLSSLAGRPGRFARHVRAGHRGRGRGWGRTAGRPDG